MPVGQQRQGRACSWRTRSSLATSTRARVEARSWGACTAAYAPACAALAAALSACNRAL